MGVVGLMVLVLVGLALVLVLVLEVCELVHVCLFDEAMVQDLILVLVLILALLLALVEQIVVATCHRQCWIQPYDLSML